MGVVKSESLLNPRPLHTGEAHKHDNSNEAQTPRSKQKTDNAIGHGIAVPWDCHQSLLVDEPISIFLSQLSTLNSQQTILTP
jgi:hypothetical protein